MNRKKQRKQSRKQRSQSRTYSASFSVGNTVRVKPGTTDPDFPDVPLGGWTGTIVEVDQRSNPPMYAVEWNKQTLNQIHPFFRVRCERDDLDFEVMYLLETDLAPDTGGPVLIEQPTQIITRPLSEFNQSDRVRAVFGLTSNDPMPPRSRESLRRYGDYLSTHLSFPFRAVHAFQASRGLMSISPLVVLGLLDADEWDEDDGILCEVELQGEQFELPLAALAVAGNRKQRQLIEDYTFWFECCGLESLATSADGQPPQDDTYFAVTDKELYASGHVLPENKSTVQPVPEALLKSLSKLGLYGAIYGFAMGSLLGTMEYSWIGMAVGALLLGVVGLMGTDAESEAGAPAFLPSKSTLPVAFRAAMYSLIGALLGAMIVAFSGTLLGALGGIVISWSLRKWKLWDVTAFGGAFYGAVIGAVGLAFYREKDIAILWALHGAWIGGLAVCIVVALAYLLVILIERMQRKEATT